MPRCNQKGYFPRFKGKCSDAVKLELTSGMCIKEGPLKMSTCPREDTKASVPNEAAAPLLTADGEVINLKLRYFELLNWSLDQISSADTGSGMDVFGHPPGFRELTEFRAFLGASALEQCTRPLFLDLLCLMVFSLTCTKVEDRAEAETGEMALQYPLRTLEGADASAALERGNPTHYVSFTVTYGFSNSDHQFRPVPRYNWSSVCWKEDMDNRIEGVHSNLRLKVSLTPIS
ncbi:hypothetical protein STEG23_018783 [Scotinomys teguina]